MNEKLKAAIAELGTGDYAPGSSATAGWLYNPLPFPGCESLKVHRPNSAKRWEMIAQHTDFSGKSVLDVGCATGYFSFMAAQNGASNVLGMDADPKAIAVCRAAAEAFDVKNVTFEHSTVCIPNQQFDIAFAMSVLNWMGKGNAGLWMAWAVSNIGMLWAEIPIRGDGRGGAAGFRDEVDVKKWLLRYFLSVEAVGETQGPHRGKWRVLYRCS